MRIALVGKIGSVIHWLEDCAAALRAEGHAVHVGVTRNPALARQIETLLLSETIGAPMAQAVAAGVARFGADLIVVIGAYEIPPQVLNRLAALPGRPPLFAWIGDVFNEAAAPIAALFDAVAYTDSGLIARHRSLGFAPEPIFLPHAVNPRAGAHAAIGRRRRELMVFVANPTDHRRAVLAAIDHPVAVHGLGWKGLAGGHEIHRRRVSPGALGGLYATHLAALNIRNEHNVLFGLNQRNFDPYVVNTPVVTDDQPDLAASFEEGSEVFVYRSVAELNDLYARLRRSPAQAAAVGESGARRVLADHTYGRRIATLAALA